MEGGSWREAEPPQQRSGHGGQKEGGAGVDPGMPAVGLTEACSPQRTGGAWLWGNRDGWEWERGPQAVSRPVALKHRGQRLCLHLSTPPRNRIACHQLLHFEYSAKVVLPGCIVTNYLLCMAVIRVPELAPTPEARGATGTWSAPRPQVHMLEALGAKGAENVPF